MSLINELQPLELSERLEKLIEVNRTSYASQWTLLPCTSSSGLSSKAVRTAWRLNSLGSPFFFIKAVLRKHRLSPNFHRYYCSLYECEHLLEVFEIPRDHFKTTIALGMMIWYALPFGDREKNLMRALGYSEEWIRWMERAHDVNTRSIFVTETIKNAWKKGNIIDREYKSNNLFRSLFKEILPDSSCQWSMDVKTHKRDYNLASANQGEGTYNFTGIDAALQSQHANRFFLDDLFGKEALKSDLVAESTWEYVRLIAGAFDSVKGNPDELPDVIVDGNRWSYKDLNWRIKKERMGFRFHTHDAEGGCCSLHPPNTPLFPEEFSIKKLARLKHWFGDYFYSCQFRNRPIPPGGNKFKLEWLKYFVFKTIPMSVSVPLIDRQVYKETCKVEQEILRNMTAGGLYQPFRVYGRDNDQFFDKRNRQYKAIHYPTEQGATERDVVTNNLIKCLWFDPNHAGEKGRSRNCIIATGLSKEPLKLHLLEGFCEISSREDAAQMLYIIGERWRIRNVWIEGSAGQSWIPTLLTELNNYKRKDGKWYFDNFLPFKDNRNENAKDERIDNSEPFYRRGLIYLCQNDENRDKDGKNFLDKFLEEYEEYPHGRFKDILDTIGHICENFDKNLITEHDLSNLYMRSTSDFKNPTRSSMTGY